MTEQATVYTGKGIDIYTLVASKKRIELERKGLKFRGGSVTALIIQKFTGDIITRTTDKQRRRAIKLIDDRLEEIKDELVEDQPE